MNGKRSLWSERHALRDQVVVIMLGLGFVFAMALALILVAHAWTAGSVSAAAR